MGSRRCKRTNAELPASLSKSQKQQGGHAGCQQEPSARFRYGRRRRLRRWIHGTAIIVGGCIIRAAKSAVTSLFHDRSTPATSKRNGQGRGKNHPWVSGFRTVPRGGSRTWFAEHGTVVERREID